MTNPTPSFRRKPESRTAVIESTTANLDTGLRRYDKPHPVIPAEAGIVRP